MSMCWLMRAVCCGSGKRWRRRTSKCLSVCGARPPPPLVWADRCAGALTDVHWRKSSSSSSSSGRQATTVSEMEELEYYVRYPSPGFKYAGGDGGGGGSGNDKKTTPEDYVFVVDERRVPIVMLFGWAGCQDRYLSKYSAIYEDKGLITLRYTAPVSCLFWRRYRMRQIGARLARLLHELRLESHPLIVHVFSNGGAFLYQNFAAALESNGCGGGGVGGMQHDQRPRAVIFDSAPGRRRLPSLYRAVSAIVAGGPLYNAAFSTLLTLLLSVVWLWEVAVTAVLSWRKSGDATAANGGDCLAQHLHTTNPFDGLAGERTAWPQHFIYSRADTLIPPEDVEEFCTRRRAAGARVSTLCFPDSPHVKHYSAYPAAYVASVCDFINRSLKDDTEVKVDEKR